MSSFEGAPTPEPTNEELVAMSKDPALTASDLYYVGSLLEERAEVALDTLKARVQETGDLRLVDIATVRGYYDLWLAQGSVDSRYGQMTGFLRKGGCSFGGPVRYRRQTL